MVQHVHEAEGEDADHVSCQRQQKEEEVPIVAPADAVVYPGAVVVEVLGGGREESVQKMDRRESFHDRKMFQTPPNTGCLSPAFKLNFK